MDIVERAQRLYSQRRGGAIVAVIDGMVVGFGMLHIWTNLGELSDLIVYAPYRGRGLGSQIVQQLCDLAIQLGTYEVEIGAFSDNVNAIRLYERLSFERHRILNVRSGKSPQLIIYLYKRLIDESI